MIYPKVDCWSALQKCFLVRISVGASLAIPEMGRLDATLFGESQGRVLVAVSSTDSNDFLSCAESAGVLAQSLGETSDSGILEVKVGEREVLLLKLLNCVRCGKCHPSSNGIIQELVHE